MVSRLLQWKIIFFLIFFFIGQRMITGLSTRDTIPINFGDKQIWIWKTSVSVASLGLVYNSITLAMMLSLDDSRKVSFYSLNLAMVLTDLTFGLARTVFAAFYLFHRRQYGGSVSCEMETITDLVLINLSILTVVGISWVARNDLCNGKKFTQRQMIAYVLACTSYSTILVMFAIYIPGGGYQLEASGTYCFLPMSSKVGLPVLYLFGMFLPLQFLFYNLLLTYKTITDAQKVLRELGIKEQAKGHYIKMVMKLGYFLNATLICYTPALCESIYEWITGQYAPYDYSAMTGLIALFLTCVINPSLFFYLNPDLRDKFYLLIIKPNLRLLGISKNKTRPTDRRKSSLARSISISGIKKRKSTILPLKIPNVILAGHTSSVSLHSPNNSKMEMKLDYNDMNNWLSEDKILSEAFRDHGRKEYVMENILFYDDARTYHFKGLDLLNKVKSVIEIESSSMVNMTNVKDVIETDINNEWNTLEQLGLRLFTLYIKIPSAPLEINIPSNVREVVSLIFESNTILQPISSLQSKKSISSGFTAQPSLKELKPFKYPSITDLSDDELIAIIEKYSKIFDESIKAIYNIIRSDIWPRFKKSNQFQIAMAEHKKEFDFTKPDIRSGTFVDIEKL